VRRKIVVEVLIHIEDGMRIGDTVNHALDLPSESIDVRGKVSPATGVGFLTVESKRQAASTTGLSHVQEVEDLVSLSTVRAIEMVKANLYPSIAKG
jgi:hypothetical protein